MYILENETQADELRRSIHAFQERNPSFVAGFLTFLRKNEAFNIETFEGLSALLEWTNRVNQGSNALAEDEAENETEPDVMGMYIARIVSGIARGVSDKKTGK